MGGSKSTQSSQQTTNTLDPWVKSLLSTNYNRASGVANTPWTPFTGQSTAPINAQQQQAIGLFGNIAANHPGQGSLDSAVSAAKAAGGYTPQMVTAPTTTSTGYAPTAAQASLLDPGQIAQFMSPYTKQVVDATSADAEHALEVQQMYNAAQATKAGAWRGSALAVQNGVAQGDSNRALDATIGNLYNTGWNQAAGLAQGNANAQQQTNLANASAADQAAQFGAGAANSAAAQNAAAALAAQQANQSAGLSANAAQLQAAGLLGTLGNDQFNNGEAAAQGLLGAGTLAQQTQQAQDNFDYSQQQQQQQWPIEMQQVMNQAIGLVPAVTNSSSTGNSTTSSTPGFGDILGGVASLGKIAAMFSDRRLKTDIKTIGRDPQGRRWVDYRYKHEPKGTHHHGLIAQETLKTDPHAVVRDRRTGLLGIRYDQLGMA